MDEQNKSERIVSILLQLIKHPDQQFSVTQLMQGLNLPESQRRNVQRDLNELLDMPGPIVTTEGSGAHKKYSLGIAVFRKFDIPDFNELILKFVFMQSVSHIYPGTGDLIEELATRTLSNLPVAQKEKAKAYFKEINSKILYMGKSVEMDDSASEKLKTILDAIRTRRQITTTYDGKTSDRIPLAIVIYQNAVYVACCRRHDPLGVYAIKLNRIAHVVKNKNHFTIETQTWEKLEKKVTDLDLFDDDREPIDVLVAFPLCKRKFIEDDNFHHSAKFTAKKGKLFVSMKVCDGTQLWQWIMRHSVNEIEVLEPHSLKEEIKDIVKSMAKRMSSKNKRR